MHAHTLCAHRGCDMAGILYGTAPVPILTSARALAPPPADQVAPLLCPSQHAAHQVSIVVGHHTAQRSFVCNAHARKAPSGQALCLRLLASAARSSLCVRSCKRDAQCLTLRRRRRPSCTAPTHCTGATGAAARV
jgi:hypothetical protein